MFERYLSRISNWYNAHDICAITPPRSVTRPVGWPSPGPSPGLQWHDSADATTMLQALYDPFAPVTGCAYCMKNPPPPASPCLACGGCMLCVQPPHPSLVAIAAFVRPPRPIPELEFERPFSTCPRSLVPPLIPPPASTGCSWVALFADRLVEQFLHRPLHGPQASIIPKLLQVLRSAPPSSCGCSFCTSSGPVDQISLLPVFRELQAVGINNQDANLACSCILYFKPGTRMGLFALQRAQAIAASCSLIYTAREYFWWNIWHYEKEVAIREAAKSVQSPLRGHPRPVTYITPKALRHRYFDFGGSDRAQTTTEVPAWLQLTDSTYWEYSWSSDLKDVEAAIRYVITHEGEVELVLGLFARVSATKGNRTQEWLDERKWPNHADFSWPLGAVVWLQKHSPDSYRRAVRLGETVAYAVAHQCGFLICAPPISSE